MNYYCDDCKKEFECKSDLAFDNETGEYYCPNCESNNIKEVYLIDIDCLLED